MENTNIIQAAAIVCALYGRPINNNVKTIADILTHPFVEKFLKDYDGRGRHSVILKDGFRFSNTECCQDIGTVKELCDSINNYLSS